MVDLGWNWGLGSDRREEWAVGASSVLVFEWTSRVRGLGDELDTVGQYVYGYVYWGVWSWLLD